MAMKQEKQKKKKEIDFEETAPKQSATPEPTSKVKSQSPKKQIETPVTDP